MSSSDFLSRRRFLASGVALAVGLADPRSLPAGREADKAPGSLRLGFSLYGMRSLKTAEALKACAEIGYRSVELVALPDWPCAPEALSKADRRDLRTRLANLGLELAGLMEHLPAVVERPAQRRNLDRLKAAAELGHELAPGRPPVVETILGGRPSQWDDLKGPMADALREWAKVGKATEAVVAAKPHVAGALHTPAGAKWLVNEIDSPWLKLAFDYSHFQLREIDLDDALRAMIAETVFIHVKDAQGTADRFRFLLPGDGDLDYAGYFRRLKQSGYRGPVVVEVSGQLHSRPDYDSIQAARRSHANLAPHL